MSEISMGIHTMPYTTVEQVLALREAAILCQREAIDQGVKVMELEKQLTAERERAEALAAHVSAANDIIDEWGDMRLSNRDAGERLSAWREDKPKSSIAQRDEHPDNMAVDRFASAMKKKLAAAREKGRGGWEDPEQCSAELLADLLVGHVGKGNVGNLEDIANLAMMLHQRGDDPSFVAQAVRQRDKEQQKLGAASFKAELHEASSLDVRVHAEGVFAVWLRKTNEIAAGGSHE